MLTRIDHVGIACRSLAEKIAFYESVFGLRQVSEEVNEEQGVREATLQVAASAAGMSCVQLLEPLGPDTPVGRFLARRGEGIHHIGYGVDGYHRRARIDRGQRRAAARPAAPARIHGRLGGVPASGGCGRRADGSASL